MREGSNFLNDFQEMESDLVHQIEKPLKKKRFRKQVLLISSGVIVVGALIASYFIKGYENSQPCPQSFARQDDASVQPLNPFHQDICLDITFVSSPVNHGNFSSLSARATPGSKASIIVNYLSGPSQAQGLNDKTVDDSGDVSWAWRVGTRTTPGDWKIDISVNHDGASLTKSIAFTVR